jgi:hypothetical protein
MIYQARQRLNIEKDESITDDELVSYFNSSLAELFELVSESFEDWFTTRFTFTIASGDDGYVMPPEFWKMLRLDKSMSGSAAGSDWYTINERSPRDENLFSSPINNAFFGSTSGYIREGNRIRPLPASQQAGTYRAVYYPAPQDATLATDIVVGPPGLHWEEYAILDVCLKCALKQETDPQGFILQKVSLIERIKKAAAQRNAGMPAPVPLSSPWYDRYPTRW